MNFLLYALAFLSSLHTYYFHEISLAFISVFASFLLIMLLVLGKSDKFGSFSKQAVLFVAFYLLIFFWGCCGILFQELNLDIKRCLGFVIIIFVFLGSSDLFKRINLHTFSKFFLLTHAFFFYFQFFSFYIFGITIDYLEPLTGEKQRMFGGSFKLPFFEQFMRPTGLFNEPGTYCAFIAPFTALMSQWYSSGKSEKFVYWLSLGTLVFSFSLFGTVFAMLIFLFSTKVSKFLRLSFFSMLSFVSLPYVYYRFVVRQELGFRGGHQERGELISKFFESIFENPLNGIFGSHNILSPFSAQIDYVIAVNDVGLIFYLMLSLGLIIWILVLIALLFCMNKLNNSSKLAFFILLISKQSLFCPFLPIVLFSIFEKSNHSSFMFKKLREC